MSEERIVIPVGSGDKLTVEKRKVVNPSGKNGEMKDYVSFGCGVDSFGYFPSEKSNEELAKFLLGKKKGSKK